jgi:chromosomal replication initiation ATPase DnaA
MAEEKLTDAQLLSRLSKMSTGDLEELEKKAKLERLEFEEAAKGCMVAEQLLRGIRLSSGGNARRRPPTDEVEPSVRIHKHEKIMTAEQVRVVIKLLAAEGHSACTVRVIAQKLAMTQEVPYSKAFAGRVGGHLSLLKLTGFVSHEGPAKNGYWRYTGAL